MTTWIETRRRMRADRIRLEAHFARDPMGRPSFLWLHPSYQAVCLHRISHYFFRRGRRVISRVFWHLNLVLTGSDISPMSNLGGGLLLRHPLGCILIGDIGENCTVLGFAGIGGGISSLDIGAGPGLPRLGNDVFLEFGAMVLGPVCVGDRTRIGPRCVVTRDIPPDSVVSLRQPRRRQAVSPGSSTIVAEDFTPGFTP